MRSKFVWGFEPEPLDKLQYEIFVTSIFGVKDAAQIFKLYGPPPPGQKDDVRYFMSVFATDYIFTCPTALAAASLAAHAPTYTYLFDHLLSYSRYVQHDWCAPRICWAMLCFVLYAVSTSSYGCRYKVP